MTQLNAMLAYTEWVSLNVIPLRPNIPSISAVNSVLNADLFDPDTLDLGQASGDFSTVVEFSAAYCLRMFDSPVQATAYAVNISGNDLWTFLNSQPTPFASPYLNGLKNQPSAVAAGASLQAQYAARSLEFAAPNKLVITYDGYFTLLLNTPLRPNIPSQFNPTITPISHIPVINLGWTSQFVATITCVYRLTSDAELGTALVYADLSASATPTVQCTSSDKDAVLFYNTFTPTQPLSPTFQCVNITPFLSLSGANPQANAFSTFAVQTVQVTSDISALPTQALALAIDVNTASTGNPADIIHFIGKHDYGIVSNGDTVGQVLHALFDNGAILKQCNLSFPCQAKYKGAAHEAIVQGVQDLLSLDVISIEVDSNSRRDCVLLAGQARITAQQVTLDDGTVISADKAKLGAPVNGAWSVLTLPVISAELSTDPATQQFQQSLQTGAYRYLAQPYLNIQPGDISLLYTRTDGVTQHVYCIGTINNLLNATSPYTGPVIQ